MLVGLSVNIVNVFNKDRVNQWYLSVKEASGHLIYFKVVRPNKYFRKSFQFSRLTKPKLS